MPRESGDLLPAGDSFHSTIPAAFEQVASEHATNTAIQSAQGPISFGALNSLANRIARELLDSTRGKQPVALLLPKGMRWVAALLGTMKAALPVAPLELNRHLSQLQFQIRDLEPDALITDTAGVGTAKSLGVRSILLADDYPAVEGEPNLGLEIHPDDLAAIFYTSGSTGRPRGVMQPHRSLVNNACVQIGQLGYQSTDRMLLLTFHVGALMSSLLSGGSSSFLSEGEGGLSGILQRIQSEQITVILATTSTFRNLANMAGGPEAFASVRLVYVGSETVFRSDVTLFQKLFPGRAVFASNYGSTEALGVAFVDLGAESFSSDIPSIGRAFAGKEIMILGPDGSPLPPGQVGELAVRSRFIGTGYWKGPDETKSRFLTDPEDSTLYTFLTRDMGEILPDGSVFLHGRQDSMVKVRGSLVPLQDVEGALAALDEWRRRWCWRPSRMTAIAAW
ncbi:MAG TPA: AMP-binding protein [Bryobacteraceae bacterium]|nr:AMP-binding protein [Bryobacteraceae bacterium]